jgi:uncharacterized membrane protein
MDKKKKKLFIIIGIIEVIVLVFCLVVSIMVASTLKKDVATDISENGPFIGYLQGTPVLFFCTIVLPVFVIFLADGAYLIVYANKKESAIGDTEKKAIEEEAKRQAREEVLKEIQAEQSAQKDPAEKPADPKK